MDERSGLGGPVQPRSAQHLAVRPLDGGAVRLEAGFWGRRQVTNREVTIPHGARMLQERGSLDNLRLAAGQPMSIQTAHIPAAFVPGLKVTENASLYEVLQRCYHLYAARAREKYFAATADRTAAELLGIPMGAAVFAVERVTMLPNEKPFEFVQSVIRGDRYSIVLELVKEDGGKQVLTLNGSATPRARKRSRG